MIDASISFRAASPLSLGEIDKVEAFLNKHEDLHILLAALEDTHCNGNTPERQGRVEDAYRAFRLNVGLVQ